MEPKAKEIEKTLEMHNDVRHDEFYWMRNHPEDPDVLSHLKVENEHISFLFFLFWKDPHFSLSGL